MDYPINPEFLHLLGPLVHRSGTRRQHCSTHPASPALPDASPYRQGEVRWALRHRPFFIAASGAAASGETAVDTTSAIRAFDTWLEVAVRRRCPILGHIDFEQVSKYVDRERGFGAGDAVERRCHAEGKQVCHHIVDDFAIYATYRLIHGRFIGSLKVVRKTDNRLLFPFEGAPTIGPFDHKEEALRASETLGVEIVEGDIANPEP